MSETRSRPLENTTVLLGRPTHYTRQFDERGMPMAIVYSARGSNDDVAGKLPDGFDPVFHDWQPRFDPDGAWVEKLEEAKAVKRKQVNAARAAAQDAGVTVSVAGDEMTFDSDAASVIEMQAQAGRLGRAMPGAKIAWTLAGSGDNEIEVTGAQLLEAADAVAAHRAEIHARSKTIHAEIDAANTLAELALVNTTF